MTLENIMLSVTNQSERIIHYKIPFICKGQSGQIHRDKVDYWLPRIKANQGIRELKGDGYRCKASFRVIKLF